jgi:hypothetical protein
MTGWKNGVFTIDHEYNPKVDYTIMIDDYDECVVYENHPKHGSIFIRDFDSIESAVDIYPTAQIYDQESGETININDLTLSSTFVLDPVSDTLPDWEMTAREDENYGRPEDY